MIIKTHKYGVGEFFTVNDLNPDTPIHLLTGARNSGKSVTAKNFCAELAANDRKFAYIRGRKSELFTVMSWLDEIDKAKFCGISTPYFFEFIRGKPKSGDISIRYQLYEDEEIEQKLIGYCYSLENSSNIKSGFYNDVDAIVFEEFARHDMTRQQEITLGFVFAELIETVVRPDNNDPIPIFLISNNMYGVSEIELMLANSPYVTKYKIFKKRKEGGLMASMGQGIKEYMEGEKLPTERPKLPHYNLFYNMLVNGVNMGFFKHKHLPMYTIRSGNFKADLGHRNKAFLLDFGMKIYDVNILFNSDRDELLYKRNFPHIKNHIEGVLYE